MATKDIDLLKILSDQKDELTAIDTDALVGRKEEALVDLDSKLAQVVIGMRRSGKSTLCLQKLLHSGVNFAYVNFDDERLTGLKTEQLDDILQALFRLNGSFTHIFLDEVQNIKAWPLFVNRLLRQGLRIVLSGSNANLLSSELATHLTGRYHQIELFPFSFAECCRAKGIDVRSLSTKAEALRMRHLDTYLQEGGFPETLEMGNTPGYTLSLLNAIVNKDICKRYKVKYKETLWKLANIILDRFCQETSSLELARELSISSSHTVENYLSYLTNAYLVHPVHKYSFKSDERKTNTKYYAADMAFVSNHDDVLQSQNLGWRLENVVFCELRRRINPEWQNIYYMKKSRDFEVDFVVTDRTHIQELIQVTYDFREPSAKLYNREVGGLLKAAELTRCKKLTLIAMEGTAGEISAGDTTVNVVRATDWLLADSPYLNAM